MYQSLLGLADQPVEYLDSYAVDGGQAALAATSRTRAGPSSPNSKASCSLTSNPEAERSPPDAYPRAHRLTRSTTFMFNLSAYTRLLISDFRAAGGKIEVTEFTSPADFFAPSAQDSGPCRPATVPSLSSAMSLSLRCAGSSRARAARSDSLRPRVPRHLLHATPQTASSSR